MESFRYKCYQTLNNTFGRVDSIVECIELAIRDLLDKADKSDNFDSYIQEIASKNKIKVNTVSAESLKVRASQLHLLNVYQQFEGYLIELKKELPFEVKLDNGEDSLLKRMLAALNHQDTISHQEIEILEYYRNIRNTFMHPTIESTKYDKACERLREKLEVQTTGLEKYNAPNKYKEIMFDDFILFTKVAKDVAEKMCTVARPSNEQIAEMLKQTKYYSRLNKYKKNQKRYAKALETLCRCEYSINKEDSKQLLAILWALA